MKRIYYFVFCSFILFSSCDEKKNIRLQTASKLIGYFENSNVDSIESLITPNLIHRPDAAGIMQDCKIYNEIKVSTKVKNIKNYTYIENDPIIAYKIIIPVFDGIDTIGNRRITKVSIEVDFGPEQVNDPHQITGYYINTEFTFIQAASSVRKPSSGFTPIVEPKN